MSLSVSRNTRLIGRPVCIQRCALFTAGLRIDNAIPCYSIHPLICILAIQINRMCSVGVSCRNTIPYLLTYLIQSNHMKIDDRDSSIDFIVSNHPKKKTREARNSQVCVSSIKMDWSNARYRYQSVFEYDHPQV